MLDTYEGRTQCAICNRIVNITECKEVKIHACNAIKLLDDKPDGGMNFYTCKDCFPLIKEVIQDAIKGVQITMKNEG